MDDYALISRLASLEFTSEEDVREEFVTPLLRLLGYDHGRGEVIRGKSLRTPYQSGTKRKEYIVPDYIAQSEKNIHLALDAKRPGNSDEEARRIVLDRAHIGQVHSYAAHREVQAPRFVISNAQYTAIFDTTSTIFEPILVVAQRDLEDQLEEISALMSKKAVSHYLASRLPIAWDVPIRRREVGFQPMNIDIGDVNQDGLPELVIALSENHIPVINARGEPIASIETDGWVWWVKCTGTADSAEATLVAIQKDRGGRDPTGRIIGVNGSTIVWSHDLERAGSGFEDLERIVVRSEEAAVIFGVPCDNLIWSVSLRGEFRWRTRISEGNRARSVMHVREAWPDRILVTCGLRASGVLAYLDARSGEILRKIALPFRGAQIEVLDTTCDRLLVTNADAPEVGIVDSDSLVSPGAIATGIRGRRVRVAVNRELGILAVAGISVVKCYSLDQITDGLPEPTWVSHEINGLVNRMTWIDTSTGTRLLLCTCGTAAQPRYNGIYIVKPDGSVANRYYLTTQASASYGLTGVRDAKAVRFTRSDAVDVVAVADDSRAYVWSPV